MVQQSFTAVTAACLVIRRSIFLQVGGLDEENLKIAFNDVDFCLRVHAAGYRNVWTPYAELYHHESATRGYEDDPEKQARFASEAQYMARRWGGCWGMTPPTARTLQSVAKTSPTHGRQGSPRFRHRSLICVHRMRCVFLDVRARH